MTISSSAAPLELFVLGHRLATPVTEQQHHLRRRHPISLLPGSFTQLRRVVASITMSLFGTSPDESSATPISSKARNSLFDDEPSPAPGLKSSLFADDDGPGSSPWGMPMPKKAGRGELIRNLLPSSDVPGSYVGTFDNVFNGGDGQGGNIAWPGIAKVLSAGRLSADDQVKITNLISPGGQQTSLGRNEFNVLLALIGLAQEGEDITLDSVDERRRSKLLNALRIFAHYRSVC